MLEKSNQEQPGSLISIKLLPQKAVNNFFSYNLRKTKVISDVTINTNIIDEWIEVYFTQDSATYSFSEKENDKGSSVDVNIELFIPSNQEKVLDFLKQYSKVNFVALVENMDAIHIIGDKFAGLRLLSDFSNPKNVNNTSGYVIKLTGAFIQAPPIYDPQV